MVLAEPPKNSRLGRPRVALLCGLLLALAAPAGLAEEREQISGLRANGLKIEGGELCRDQVPEQGHPAQGNGVPLGCTLAGGPGEIHAVDKLPGGTTFIAAQRGLFALSADVKHLDPVELKDGAPAGAPLGIVAQGTDRLWIVTQSELGCIDTRQAFGRTVPAAELPGGPYSGLWAGNDGALHLGTSSGLFVYRPDQGSGPGISALTINGQGHVPGKRIELDHGNPLVLQAQGQANGGATFRYRLQDQHRWTPLERSAETLAGLEPGNHKIYVSAFDRDLRRSAPAVVQVHVRYPAMLATNRLPLILLGVCSLLLVGFLGCARKLGGGFARYKRALLSCFLLILVGFQAVVGLVFPHGRSWPFVGFTMYTQSFEENQAIHHQKLYIRRVDGLLRELPRLKQAYNEPQLRQALVPVAQGDAQAREQFLQLLNSHLEASYAGFLVLDHRTRLTPAGPIPIAPIVQCAYPPELFDDR